MPVVSQVVAGRTIETKQRQNSGLVARTSPKVKQFRRWCNPLKQCSRDIPIRPTLWSDVSLERKLLLNLPYGSINGLNSHGLQITDRCWTVSRQRLSPSRE